MSVSNSATANPPEAPKKRIDQREKLWNMWKLSTDEGRQVWKFDANIDVDDNLLASMSDHFKFDKSTNPNSGDKVYRHFSNQNKKKDLPEYALKAYNFRDSLLQKAYACHFKGIQYYSSLQADDGHWPGDYGGPLFLLPGLVIASYLTKTPFPDEHKALMVRYMVNHQNDDGGWGLHIEGDSTVFGTVMQYIALRILGTGPGSPELSMARKWIIEHGGARYIPSWGKFYLSLLNLYEWKGCGSLLPELWLLPRFLFFHPSRFWCHARMVFLPMSYCYGRRIKCPANKLILDLRKEIYCEDYDKIDWVANTYSVASTDNFWPVSKWLKRLNKILIAYEKIHIRKWRKKALRFVLDYVKAEDQQTDHIDIGPVNQIINSICIWHALGNDSAEFKKHAERWFDYLWLAEDGMKMNGYNGSQLWDTTFAVQAIVEDPDILSHQIDVIEKAYRYINRSQVVVEIENGQKYFRHRSEGGWPFSTKSHGWPISDCTSEGLYTVLKLHKLSFPFQDAPIEPARLKKSVDLILSLQNKDGGWATYENSRGNRLLEILNSSEVFGQIMIDYSWTECTSACIKALCEFKKSYPGYRSEDIDTAVERGIKFILSQQRPDGSWQGSWGVCFTYGTWFALEALSKVGHRYPHPAIKKACEFLKNHQNHDGGWGESYFSCVKQTYIPHRESQVVNTAWATLALMAIDYPDKNSIIKGLKLIMDRQQDNGDWLQEGISGVFNQNCMITYTAYRNVFPIWAVARYLKKFG